MAPKPDNRAEEMDLKPARTDIPISYVASRLLMDEEGRLFWRPRVGVDAWATAWNEMYAGKRAEHINSRGYLTVNLVFEGERLKLQSHRIVWALMNSKWPSPEIDHINRNKTDNRRTNLREATRAENMQNRALLFRRGRQGIPGVYFTRTGKPWSQVWINGQLHYLGTFDTTEAAAAAFNHARKQRSLSRTTSQEKQPWN